MVGNPSNENSVRWLEGDPNGPYVEEYLAKMLAHFQDCHIHFGTVARLMVDALIKLAPGKPYEKEPEAADLRAGLSILDAAAHNLEKRADAYHRAYEKARTRLHLKRLEQLAAKHDCSLEEAQAIWVASQQDKTDPQPSDC